MRAALFLSAFLPIGVMACTAFKVTREGRTLVGNNEDAWSINARVRFVNGVNGGFGAVYFSHYNGSPLRHMTDQGGMNEAGLMFDGFVVPVTELHRQHGPLADVHALVARAMRTCATAREVASLFRAYDFSPLNGGMLFFCDRAGNYLVVEADTLLTGNDATYAVSNFRASQCPDFNAVPIARYQRGRRMLASGPDTALARCTALLDSMSVCRRKLGEGTLYSYLADLDHGIVHLFFYHDFTTSRSFDLKQELAKGDHELEMAALFPANAEYERLLGFKTPFHERWMLWSVVAIGALSLIGLLWASALFVMQVVVSIRSRSLRMELPWLPVGVASALALFLCGALVLNEGVYYFGLNDVMDRIHPLLTWSPMALLLLVAYLFIRSYKRTRFRLPTRGLALVHSLLLVALAYWDLLWP